MLSNHCLRHLMHLKLLATCCCGRMQLLGSVHQQDDNTPGLESLSATGGQLCGAETTPYYSHAIFWAGLLPARRDLDLPLPLAHLVPFALHCLREKGNSPSHTHFTAQHTTLPQSLHQACPSNQITRTNHTSDYTFTETGTSCKLSSLPCRDVI